MALLLLTTLCLWGLVWAELLSSWFCCRFIPLGDLAPCHAGSAEVWLCASSTSRLLCQAPLGSAVFITQSHTLLRDGKRWAGAREGRVHMANPGSLFQKERVETVPLVVCAHPLLPLKPHPVMTSVWYRTAARPCPCGSELWPLSETRASVFCVSSDGCLSQLCALNPCSN